MAENITYAEMNLNIGKGKGQGKTNSVNLQDADVGVTYVDIKKPLGKKKEKPSKREKVFDPPQSEDAAITYAVINKKKSQKSPQEDPAGGEDITVTYAALRETTKKKVRKCEKSREGDCEEKSTCETCVIVREDQNCSDWKHRLLRGRHCSVLLVPFLVTLCFILLIIIITWRTSCMTSSAGNGSGPSFTADWSSPCPDPWILVTNKCYFFSETRKNQKDSKEDCEKRKSRLATVKEGAILKLVAIMEQEFWIGLERLGTHHQEDQSWSGRWADGSIENLPKGSGSCAKIKGNLSLHNCQWELHWICEREVPAR